MLKQLDTLIGFACSQLGSVARFLSQIARPNPPTFHCTGMESLPPPYPKTFGERIEAHCHFIGLGRPPQPWSPILVYFLQTSCPYWPN
jgi:hypothetical protein